MFIHRVNKLSGLVHFLSASLVRLWKHLGISEPHINTYGLFLPASIFVKNESLCLCLREWSCQLSRCVSARSQFHLIYGYACGFLQFCVANWTKKLIASLFSNLSLFPTCPMIFWSNFTRDRHIMAQNYMSGSREQETWKHLLGG